ncbi:MAG: hypothetical protein QGH74_04890 [Candidatus Brocadiia bacterium]|jgi:hypothetical protein|nr:hypothetical protein [Candidatus Brocadiia bacterium]
MVKCTRAILAALIVGALSAGCASPTPADLERADLERVAVKDLLSAFRDAVRAKDAETAAASISPHLFPQEKARLRRMIGEAVRMKLYTGYRFDVEQAVAKLSWKRLNGGRVRLKVKAGNVLGMRFKDRYELARADEQWRIVDMRLNSPAEGEPLDPPAAEAARIRAALTMVMELLKEGKSERVYYMLLGAGGAKPGSLGRGEARLDRALRELMSLKDYTILRWPDSADEIGLSYVAFNMIVGSLHLAYTWPAAGIIKPAGLRIDIFLLLKDDRWLPYLVRVYGSKELP